MSVDLLQRLCVKTSLSIGDEPENQGSGFIIKKNDYFYVVSAHHCIYGEDGEYKDITPDNILIEHQKENYQSPFTPIKVEEIISSNEQEDWALLRIADPNLTIDFSRIKLGIPPQEGNDVHFCGYQQLNPDSYRPFDARLLSRAVQQFRITLTDKSFSGGSEEGAEVAKGLSGSGVGVESNNTLYFIGLLKSVIGNEALNDDIDCCSISCLSETLQIEPEEIEPEQQPVGHATIADVIAYYTNGSGTTIPQFTVGVENFVANYLGSDDNPKPFGGRKEQLLELEEWRTEGESQRLLLAAPAGRGKSALLVRWSQYFVDQEDVEAIFMPISVRFNTNLETNFFAILATRLAFIYGKEIPTAYAAFTSSAWRGLAATYLKDPLPDGKQLILIFDGLDEAAWSIGADLFPSNLPDSTRIVVSARYKGGEEKSAKPWLRQLGWDPSGFAKSMELNALNKEGIKDVLLNMGQPFNILGKKEGIVAKLHHLTKGDPLLVELYVNDLKRQEDVVSLRPEDLDQFKPGYQGYFDKWWDDQKKLFKDKQPLKEKLVRSIMQILIIALGPLKTEDIQTLLQISGQDDVDGFLISESIEPLSRFLIGDGDEQGLAFSHPKLTDYFYNHPQFGTAKDRAKWKTYYLSWGKQILTELQNNSLDPQNTPQYLMLYYGRHLARQENGVDDALALISWEWAQVWHSKTGTYAGFLQDNEGVQKQLQDFNQSEINTDSTSIKIGEEIKCHLFYSSINSLAANIPPTLLLKLLTSKKWTEEQVLNYTRQKPLTERIKCYEILFTSLSAPNQELLLNTILRDAQAVQSNPQKLGHYLRFLAANVQTEQKAKILPLITQIEDNFEKIDLYRTLAPKIPNEIFQISQTDYIISADGDAEQRAAVEQRQADILTALIPILPDQVFEATITIQNETIRASLLKEFLEQHPETHSQKVFTETINLNEFTTKISLLERLAETLPLEVLNEINQIEDDVHRGAILEVIASHQPYEVLSQYKEIEDTQARYAILEILASHLSQDEITTEINQIEDISQRIDLAISTLTDNNDSSFDPEFTKLESIEDPFIQASNILKILPFVNDDNKTKGIALVLNTIQMIDNELRKSELLEKLVPYALETSKAEAEKLVNETGKVRVFTSIATYAPEQIFLTLPTIQKAGNQTRLLLALLKSLPADAADFRQQIFQFSLTLPEPSKIQILSALSPHLPQDVIQETKQIKNEKRQARLLEELIAYVPEDVLQFVQDNFDDLIHIKLLEALAPIFPKEVLNFSHRIEDDVERSKIWTLLIEKGAIATDVLRVTQEIHDEEQVAQCLIDLASHVEESNPYYETALATLKEIRQERKRCEQLGRLASIMPTEIFNYALTLQDEKNKAFVLRELAAVADISEEVLKSIETHLVEDVNKIYVLEILALHLPDEVIEASLLIEDKDALVDLYKLLAQSIPEKIWTLLESNPDYEALIPDILPRLIEHVKIDILPAIAKLPLEERATTLKNMLVVEEDITIRLTELKTFNHPDDLLPTIIDKAKQTLDLIVNEPELNRNAFSTILEGLAPHEPEVVLNHLESIKSPSTRMNFLIRLAPFIPKDVLSASAAIVGSQYRSRIHAILAQHLPDEILDQVDTFNRESWKSTILASLAPYKPKEVLTKLQHIREEKNRFQILVRLAKEVQKQSIELATTLDNTAYQSLIIKNAMRSLPTTDTNSLYDCIVAATPIYLNFNRQTYLSTLADFTDAVKQLGGQESVVTALESTTDVAQYWP